jgi:hypothetical protein
MLRINFISFTFVFAFGLGIFAGTALALLAVALARPEDTTTVIEPTQAPVAVVPTLTPSPTPTTAPPTVTPVPVPRTLATLQVRIGPDVEYAVLGTLARGSELQLQGRDTTGDWLAIDFPPGSSARGWVPTDAVDGLSLLQVFRLDVLQASLIPNAPAAFTPFPIGGNDGVPDGDTVTPIAGNATALPRSTPTPVAPAFGPTDLALSSISVASDGRLVVVVHNAGPSDSPSAEVQVTVEGAGSETLSTGVLREGATVTLRTSGLHLTEPANVTVEIDPASRLADGNRSNNSNTVPLSP